MTKKQRQALHRKNTRLRAWKRRFILRVYQWTEERPRKRETMQAYSDRLMTRGLLTLKKFNELKRATR